MASKKNYTKNRDFWEFNTPVSVLFPSFSFADRALGYDPGYNDIFIQAELNPDLCTLYLELWYSLYDIYDIYDYIP